MEFLDHSFDDPAMNLACDAWLHERCERDGVESLRFWESKRYFTVLGASGKWGEEVHTEVCKRDGVPYLRRKSGGGTVLQGPGCLNYAVVLHLEDHRELSRIESAFRWVLTRHAESLGDALGKTVEKMGTSDLVLEGRKFSGNAQHRKKHSVLIHGTFLLSFDIERIATYVRMPVRQPDYRRNRSHGDFLVNIGIPAHEARNVLRAAWSTKGRPVAVDDPAVRRLALEFDGGSS